MRTVYVDVLIAVNLFIDFILLSATKSLLHIRAPFYRLLLGAAAGGVGSLAALLPSLPFWLNLPLDLALAAAIVLTAFGFGGAKRFIKRLAVYFGLSFLFSGSMIFLYSAFRPKGLAVYNDVVYFNISPVLFIILTLLCYYMLRLIKRLTKDDCVKRICNAEITICGTTLSFAALADTGCALREPFSGKPVIIAEAEILQDLRPNGDTIRLIPFESLGGSGMLRGYPIDRVLIDGAEIREKMYLGVCEGALKGEVKAIVPSLVLNEIHDERDPHAEANRKNTETALRERRGFLHQRKRLAAAAAEQDDGTLGFAGILQQIGNDVGNEVGIVVNL